MLSRLVRLALVGAFASVSFGGCLYPDLDSYAGPCQFTGRDSSCGKCLVSKCEAATDALCDGTTDADYELKELDRCAPTGKCSATSFEGAFSECMKSCPACTINY